MKAAPTIKGRDQVGAGEDQPDVAVISIARLPGAPITHWRHNGTYEWHPADIQLRVAQRSSLTQEEIDPRK